MSSQVLKNYVGETMTDEDPTNADLEKRIDTLETELDEMQSKLNRLLEIEEACRNMAQKLADKNGDALADWWWPV